MKSCKNCINKNGSEDCKKCRNRSNWQHDGEPSVCDGCAYIGRYEIENRHCYHCVDGSKKISPELYEARKKGVEK